MTKQANSFSTSMMALGKTAGLKRIRQPPDHHYMLITNDGQIVSLPSQKPDQRSV